MLAHQLQDRSDDIAHIAITHLGIDRQGDFALEFAICDWEIGWRIAVCLLVVGMQVQGDEVHAGANVQSFNSWMKRGD